MKDVARLAGVSQTTVSFVVNQVENAGIAAETQARVHAAIAELGYRPNRVARSLRAQRTHTIGLISDVIATTPNAGRIIHGAQDETWKNNILLMLINTNGVEAMEQVAVDTMLEHQVDGILYSTMYHREVSPPDLTADVPMVLLDCFVRDGSLPSVVPDEVLGGYTATKALLENGHSRIAFINTIDPIPAASGRLEGYRQALQEYGIAYDERLVVRAITDPNGGHEAALGLLKLEPRPTGIFCFSDIVAVGAYRAAAELGLAIPDDLATVGFDNQELIAPWLSPPLTTLQLPHEEMGRWAVNHLLKIIADPEDHLVEPIQHKIECPLIERQSI